LAALYHPSRPPDLLLLKLSALGKGPETQVLQEQVHLSLMVFAKTQSRNPPVPQMQLKTVPLPEQEEI
jgi:hypothetical protein